MQKSVNFFLFLGVSLFASSTSSPIETQVVGGSLAELKQFPYLGALLKPSLLLPVICGASILDSRYLLTAAHCVYEANPAQFTVRVGQVHLDPNLTMPYEQEIPVNEFIIHPQYSPSRFLNDLAIIELASPLTLDGEFVAAIELPTQPQQDIPSGSECQIAGWGATREGGSAERDLR
jgi:secreted trypsin-like serine protease